MKTRSTCLLTALTLTLGAAAAHAGSISLTTSEGGMIMRSGDLTSMFGGAHDNDFSDSDMDGIHSTLHSSGISTDGMITVLLADTADGLGFITLLDDDTQTLSGPGVTCVGMSSVAPDTANYWINDSWQDATNRNLSAGTMNVDGTFAWVDRRAGDAFAWTNLAAGDEVTFDWSFEYGECFPGTEHFQFLTFGDSGWEILDLAAFDDQGGFAFAFTVVPLPPPLLMGLAGLGAVAVLRRRLR